MPDDRDRRFTDEEADRIWRRAAELQARRRLPVSRDEGGDRGARALEPRRLSSEEVMTIAGEAGIEPEFVRQALTEAELTPAVVALDDDADALLARRQTDAPIDVVHAVAKEVAERAPYSLRLVDIRSADATRVLVFDLDAGWGTTLKAGSFAAGDNATALHLLLRGGARPGGTEMVLYGVPNPRLPRYVRIHDLVFGGGGGFLGGAAGLAGGLGLALPGAAVAVPAAVGALALGAVAAGTIRRVQKWSRRKDQASLEKLADEIVGAIRIRRHAGRLELTAPSASSSAGSP